MRGVVGLRADLDRLFEGEVETLYDEASKHGIGVRAITVDHHGMNYGAQEKVTA